MKTTIPFEIKYNVENSLYEGRQPVFIQIPTEDDFKIAINGIDFGSASKRVFLDFQSLKLTMAVGKSKYLLVHERSFEEGASNYLIGEYNSWVELIGVVKALINKEKDELSSFVKYLERLS